MTTKEELKKKFIIWLVIAIVWWISPLDDLIEAGGGPLAFLDEIGLSSVAIYKGFRAFLKTNVTSGAKMFASIGLQKVNNKSAVVGKQLSNVVTSEKIEKVVDTVGKQAPLKSNKVTDASDIQDMSLF